MNPSSCVFTLPFCRYILTVTFLKFQVPKVPRGFERFQVPGSTDSGLMRPLQPLQVLGRFQVPGSADLAEPCPEYTISSGHQDAWPTGSSPGWTDFGDFILYGHSTPCATSEHCSLTHPCHEYWPRPAQAAGHQEWPELATSSAPRPQPPPPTTAAGRRWSAVAAICAASALISLLRAQEPVQVQC